MPTVLPASISETTPPQTMVGTEVLEVCGATYRAPNGRVLLSGVSARLEPGRILAVIGPNGAGKTTLLRLLAGELAAHGGEVRLAGRALSRWTARDRARRVGVLPQQSGLTAALTGLEVALLGRSAHPAQGDGAADLASAYEALELMDAGHLADRLYPSLSGGEKARVHAARVLAQIWGTPEEQGGEESRFLLLDEPTAALDCAHQHHLLTRVREMAQRQRVGVLAVLHDLNLAAQYADKLLALNDGRAVASGPVRTVFRAEVLSEVFGMEWLVFPHPLHDWPLAVAR